jgi:hypothetical protein
MPDNKFIELNIDKDFMRLSIPMQKNEYIQFEESLVNEGCIEPIVTWNNYIIDGHKRYKICKKYNIPFKTINMNFEHREEVIVWICIRQLSKDNISEEARKFLIGTQYSVEKYLTKIKTPNWFSNYMNTADLSPAQRKKLNKHRTAMKVAEENHVCHATVQKYAIYSRALDEIRIKFPDMANKILTGYYKISHENVIEISKLSVDDLKKIAKKLEYSQYNNTAKYSRSRSAIHQSQTDRQQPSIKDMPTYDPDASITGLTLTIPSWISSITKTIQSTDLSEISIQAKAKLKDTLYNLDEKITEIIKIIDKGDIYNG